MNELDMEDIPGVKAKHYLERLRDSGYYNNIISINLKELETKIAGMYNFDDIHITMDTYIKKEIHENDIVSIWTDGSIVKEENAVAGIGIIGINQNNEVIIVGSASLYSTRVRMEIYDIETLGVLVALSIGKNIKVKNIYCDNTSVINQLSPILKNKPYKANLLWVKAHENNEFNNMADGLAKNGRYIAKKENILNDKNIHLSYISGVTHKRTGWLEVQVLKSINKKIIFKEENIAIHNNYKDIKNIYVWERLYPEKKSISSQYIIAHCDKNNKVICIKRGVVNNKNIKSGRFLNTDFILSRLPKNKNNYNLYLSNFMADRYNIDIECDDKENELKFSRHSYKNKIKQIGYNNLIFSYQITNNNFSKIMNNSSIIVKEKAQEVIKSTMTYFKYLNKNNNKEINIELL